MSPATRAKLDLTFAVAVFGTIGIFVRSIPLPSSVIALGRGFIGTLFLLLSALLRGKALDTAAIPAGAERVTFVVEEGQA